MLDDRAMFVVLAEAGSFASAARQLGVARSTVMRRLDALEAEIGVTLVQRAGQRIVLTDRGRRYADTLRPLLHELSQVEQRVLGSDDAPSGPLRVWLPILGTGHYIASAVAGFQRQYPDVVPHLEMGRDIRHLELGAFDAALQIGFRLNAALEVRTILRDRMILVASRDYLRVHGTPQSESDLASHRAIHERDVEGKLVPWRRPDGSRVVLPKPSAVVNSAEFAFQLGQGGVGIVRTPMLLARAELDAGRLIQLLPEVWTEAAVNFVFLPDPTPATRAFVDFMARWFRDLTTADTGAD